MRGRILSKAQAEVIAVFVLALLLVLMIGVAIRFYIMANQTLKQVEERKREIQQTVLSGGVRGYIENNTVYLASGVPLLVYSVMIHNGSHILWSNPSPPSGLTSYRIAMPVMEIGDIYVPIYSGSLASLIEQCKARIVLVTDKGLIKWCPNIITKYINNTVTALLTPMTPVGSFKVYYVGNISFFGIYGNWTGSSNGGSDYSWTSLYPVIIFYNDPVAVSERWSNTVVNVTLRNAVTGDVAWIAFDVAKGSVVGSRAPSTKGNSYFVIEMMPSNSIASATSIAPVSLGGVDIFAFTAYYTSGSSRGVYVKELFTGATLRIDPGSFTTLTVYSNFFSCSGSYYNYVNDYVVKVVGFGNVYIGVVYPYTGVGSFAPAQPMYIYGDIEVGGGSGWEHFKTEGSAPITVSYYIYSPTLGNGATGTGTSWSICRDGSISGSLNGFLHARGAIKLPSGSTATIGLYLKFQASVTATPSPPTSTPAPPTQIVASWFVKQEPTPTSTTPIKTTITVFTAQPINASQYKIVITIANKAANTETTQTVQPTYLQSYGWGYQITLGADAPYSVEIKVQYFDKTKNDYVTVFRWSGGNYLGAT